MHVEEIKQSPGITEEELVMLDRVVDCMKAYFERVHDLIPSVVKWQPRPVKDNEADGVYLVVYPTNADDIDHGEDYDYDDEDDCSQDSDISFLEQGDPGSFRSDKRPIQIMLIPLISMYWRVARDCQ
eukprot:scaffold4311_cov177-Amphora_coffeaeformis.AAC.4